MDITESSRYQFILYGDRSTKREIAVNDPPVYRSTYITGAQVNGEGHLILAFSDGKNIDSGYVMGNTGAQGPQGLQGASVRWCNSWSSTIEYSYLDCVTFNGNVYIYISSVSTIGTAVTNTTYWDLMIKRGEPGVDGTNGINGTTFTPSVDASGTLSWTNNGNLPNPSSVNLKGQPGKDFKVIGYFNTESDLADSITHPVAGDAYGVGTNQPYDIYVFDGVSNTWINNGPLQGPAGPAGEKPVKGVDYFTSDDKQELVAETVKLVDFPVQSVNGQTGAVTTLFEIMLTSVGSANSWSTDVESSVTYDQVIDALRSGQTIVARIGDYFSGGPDLIFNLASTIPGSFSVGDSFSILLSSSSYDTTNTLYMSLTIAPNGISGRINSKQYIAQSDDVGKNTSAISDQTERVNLVNGEKLSTLLGKIKKWFSDLGDLAFKSKISRTDLDTDIKVLPNVDSADDGKFLRVAGGVWTAVSMQDANGNSF